MKKNNLIAIFVCVCVAITLFAFLYRKEPKPAAKKTVAPVAKIAKTETPKPTETPPDDVGKRYEDTLKEIKELEKNWAKAGPVDRPSALFAVNPIQVSHIPDVENDNARKGDFTGEIVSFTIVGAPRDIAALAQSAEMSYSGLTIERIEIKYQLFDIVEATFKVFAPVKIIVEPLSPTASKEEKEAASNKLESLLKEAENLSGEVKRPFGFINELILRWPFDFPLIDRIVFENDTFTVYPITPLTSIDPLLVELGLELSKAAAPAKVNLTPLVSQLIDGRDVVVAKKDNQLTLSWNNFQILNVQAPNIASYLIDRNHVFVLLSDKNSQWILRCYNLQDGAISWEKMLSRVGVNPTNLFLDPLRRMVVGHGYLVEAYDPENGDTVKRWFMNGVAKEVYSGESGGVAVKEINNGAEFTEQAPEENRTIPLQAGSGYIGANQLFSETLWALIQEPSDSPSIDKTARKTNARYFYQVHVYQLSANAANLADKDPSNPWIPFFVGMAEAFSTGVKKLDNFQKAVDADVDNPFHYLMLALKFDALGYGGLADDAYEKTFRKFIGWYRPSETSGRSMFDQFVNNTARGMFYSGNAARAEKLIRWANKFSPYASGADRFELERSAWWHKRKNKKLESEALFNYEIVSGKVFGGGIRRDIYFRIANSMVRLFSICAFLFLVYMTIKYRKARADRLSELGFKDFKARLRMIRSNPMEWLRHNTLFMMGRKERLVLLVLWFALLTSISSSLIVKQLKDSPNYKAFVNETTDFNWRAFLDNSLNSQPTPEAAFILGAESQRNADYAKAKSYYSNPIFKSAKSQIAAKSLNNLGVIAFMNGDLKSAQKYFKDATGKDGDAPEPLYNLGVVEKKDSYKRKAVEMGLEREYLNYYYDKPARSGLDDETVSRAFAGFGSNIPLETLRHFAEALTGNLAWKYGSKNLVAFWYFYIIIGILILIYQFAPLKFYKAEPTDSFRPLDYALPGFQLIRGGKTFSGLAILLLFVFSILSIYLGVKGVYMSSGLLYPNLSAHDILIQEPLLRKIKMFGLVATPIIICFNALYSYKIAAAKK